MNRKVLAATCLFAALVLGSPLSAAPLATKKSIRIDSTTRGGEHCTGKFFLQLGKDGDGGKVECRMFNEKEKKTPDGLEYLAYEQETTFTGKAGTLAFHVVARAYDLGFGTHVNESGTWSAVSGTGTYDGTKGRGRWVGVHDQSRNTEQIRYAGSVTLPS
ncbi:MAG TPA: hypothetical protein VFT33_02115 [Gaiellaceae bacterium]|nr:hypothetical protein [Gaiellaceae bacterium]